MKEVHMKNKEKKPRKNRNGKGNRRKSLVLDSECSGYMTGYKSQLSEFKEKAGPNVSYGDGNLGKILGYGKIKIGNVIIEDVALVVRLKHNLISVSQICDREEARLPTYFWAEAVQTACFTQNTTLINMHGKTPFEMVKGKKPNFKYFHIFGLNPEITPSSDDPHDSENSSNTEAYVEEEQHDSNTEFSTSDSTQGTSVNKSSDSHSSNSDESNTDRNGNTDSGGASGHDRGISQRSNREFMDQGEGSSSRIQVPSARKWSKSHITLLRLGESERTGKVINRGLMRTVTKMLADTRKTLRSLSSRCLLESQQFIACCDCGEYLKKAETRLNVEIERVSHYLDSKTEVKITNVVEKEMIESHFYLKFVVIAIGTNERVNGSNREGVERFDEPEQRKFIFTVSEVLGNLPLVDY
ncbi:hypothetical protein AgCh_012259 [Apium graveolens]